MSDTEIIFQVHIKNQILQQMAAYLTNGYFF